LAKEHKRNISIALLALFVLMMIPLPTRLDGIRKESAYFIYYVFSWFILGVASSFGFGTGIPTFILYLGPHIVETVKAANECGFVPATMPSRWW